MGFLSFFLPTLYILKTATLHLLILYDHFLLILYDYFLLILVVLQQLRAFHPFLFHWIPLNFLNLKFCAWKHLFDAHYLTKQFRIHFVLSLNPKAASNFKSGMATLRSTKVSSWNVSNMKGRERRGRSCIRQRFNQFVIPRRWHCSLCFSGNVFFPSNFEIRASRILNQNAKDHCLFLPIAIYCYCQRAQDHE